MSILDYLNEDCWRLALSYVPVCDVIRTERVSRRWQTVVLRYLASIRIGIQNTIYDICDTFIFLRCGVEHWLNVETINLPSFEMWSNKLGESVVAVYCDSEQSLKIVGKHCPNVKAVKFFELPEHLISAFGTFKELEAICFSNCDVSDDCVGKFLANTDVKFLDIWTINARITGQCFSKGTKNMKRLVLYDCKELDLHHLIAADLRGLMELELHFAPVEITKNMQSLLRNMPNLVVLDVTDDELMCKGFFEAVSELSCLEFLYASFAVTDEEFILVARSCGRLRALILDNCSFVTRRGVAAACARAGPRFVWLGVSGADLTDADVETAVSACPNLIGLDVRWCERLTPALLPRMAAARRELRARLPLRVLVSYTDLYGTEEKHEELILDNEALSTELIKFELYL